MTVDFERGAKVAGSKFYFTTGADADREWELISAMIGWHAGRGYTFIIPPYLVRESILDMAGQRERFAEGEKPQFYRCRDDDLVLIPTAETALVGLHAGEIMPEADLPLRYVAFSPCFRREAGASGLRDKGLRRVHQFHKVELFVICKPEDSDRLHTEMLDHVRLMLRFLGFSSGGPEPDMRVVELPEHGPDARSPMSAKTWDIELRAGQDWVEVSSISNTEDRQSRRAKIRYRPDSGGKPVRCHLLNGSGVALPRLLLALEARDATP